MKDAYRPEVVRLGNGVTEKDLLVHDEQAPIGYSAMLAELKLPEFPLPVGIIRRVDAPVFDTSMRAQIEQITTEMGPGDLRKILHAGNTWDVT